MMYYPGDMTGSLDVRDNMRKNEVCAFRWLLDFLWESSVQCFLLYSLDNLKNASNESPKKFLDMWKRILFRKFKFAKYNGEVYIYNERQVLELNRQHHRSKVNRGNAKKGAEKRQKGAPDKKFKAFHPHPFKDSPYFERQKFIAELNKDEYYSKIDAELYYESVMQWSIKNKPDPMSADWIAVAKSFVLSDAKKQAVSFQKGLDTDNQRQITRRLKTVAKSLQKKDFIIP